MTRTTEKDLEISLLRHCGVVLLSVLLLAAGAVAVVVGAVGWGVLIMVLCTIIMARSALVIGAIVGQMIS